MITLGSHNIPFSDSARNLGFILDSKLSMKKHFTKICQTAYFELKRISSIRRFLTEDKTKTLVTSYILSRLDYCSCLLIILSSNLYREITRLRHHHSSCTVSLRAQYWGPFSSSCTLRLSPIS